MGDEERELARAFSVETPDDNRRLYATWADDYDGFVDRHGYIHHRSVVDAFAARDRPDGAVVDIGCGTGAVGAELRARGMGVVDGVDLSPEMLAVAADKQAPDGRPVYRNLVEADLTVGVGVADGTYAGVVSAGAFTHGHLGPEPLDELVRLAGPGAVLAVGVNADHYEAAGFATWFERRAADGAIVELEVALAPVYDRARYRGDDAAEHADTRSAVAVFRRPPADPA